MDKELQLLCNINNNKHVTQRNLAKDLGLSLGSINAILQNMIIKGYVNAQQINSRSLKYTLTPLGKKAKDKKTYDEVVVSYQMVSRVRQITKKIIREQVSKGYNKFYLYGNHDELYKLVKMSIIEAKRIYNIEYFEIDNIVEITNQEGIILTWNKNKEEINPKNNLVLNILSCVI
ncbi:MAG: winged helix-turn-helix transcriptional regulator [Vallitalea sp.]|jgi:DNA-binding MarR family transcriptional regulator|nr:winged helix-turn-helix transcriptional regulator [Vallitalea sp.]